MKSVIYTEPSGFRQRRLVKDSDTPAMAAHGIPAGPPDLRELKWEEILLEMNNLLVENHVFDWDSLQENSGVINVVLKVLRKEIIRVYREEHRRSKEK